MGLINQSTHFRFVAALSLMLAIVASTTFADTQDVVFTIDPTQSTLDYSYTDPTHGTAVPDSLGSDSSAVSGHFLVSFDPLTDKPTSIQFLGGDGYFQQATDLSVHDAAGDHLKYSDLNWDFSSPALTGSGGVFPATTTNFSVLAGTLTETPAVGSPTVVNEDKYKGTINSGTWTLSESAPGSGAWTLSMSGYHTPSNPPGTVEKFTLSAVATAQFGIANITTLSPTTTSADVLGGAAATGGVSINLPGDTNGGTFSAQQVPNNTGLSQQAIAAAQVNPIFAASTADLSVHPQIWDVEYTGLQKGQDATLVFHYDPSLLPAGTDQSQLGIWHFNTTANAWQFGGTVNTTDHTITFVTGSFSPFELGVKTVPEPATIVLVGLAW